MHTAPYFAAFGLLTILHSWRVISLRRKHRVAFGTGNLPELDRMIRVFGNFTEYAPIGLILLIALEFVMAPYWYMHVCGVTLLLGRTLHAVALGKGRGVGRGRTAGMLLTLLSILLSSIGVLVFSMFGTAT
jgi:uncharacterized membrane protein YecN with MAPEG domain